MRSRSPNPRRPCRQRSRPYSPPWHLALCGNSGCAAVHAPCCRWVGCVCGGRGGGGRPGLARTLGVASIGLSPPPPPPRVGVSSWSRHSNAIGPCGDCHAFREDEPWAPLPAACGQRGPPCAPPPSDVLAILLRSSGAKLRCRGFPVLVSRCCLTPALLRYVRLPLMRHGARACRALSTLILSGQAFALPSGGTRLAPLLAALRETGYHALGAIHVWHTALSDTDVLHLSRFLECSPGVSVLELMDCSVTACGARLLGTSLRLNTSLRTLVLDYNGAIGDAGVAGIAQGLILNAGLHTLSLRFCGVGRAGAEALGVALATASVACLVLDHNEIGGAGAAALVARLASNTALGLLSLVENSIDAFGEDDDNALVFVDALGSFLGANDTFGEGTDSATAEIDSWSRACDCCAARRSQPDRPASSPIIVALRVPRRRRSNG